MIQKFLLAVILVFSVNTSFAKELKGVTFADQMKVGGTTLKLNGMGIRKVYSIIDVYVGGLYLAELSKDSDAILKTTTPKVILMHFKRWVPKDKMQDAWHEGFEKNAESDYSYRADLTKLNDSMAHMKDGDEMSFTIFNDHVDVKAKDNPVQTIQGDKFARTLLKVFIKDPPDEDLKKGMLSL